jgi:hypothetical protein
LNVAFILYYVMYKNDMGRLFNAKFIGFGFKSATYNCGHQKWSLVGVTSQVQFSSIVNRFGADLSRFLQKDVTFQHGPRPPARLC